jgi:hypothetical protein
VRGSGWEQLGARTQTASLCRNWNLAVRNQLAAAAGTGATRHMEAGTENHTAVAEALATAIVLRSIVLSGHSWPSSGYSGGFPSLTQVTMSLTISPELQPKILPRK